MVNGFLEAGHRLKKICHCCVCDTASTLKDLNLENVVDNLGLIPMAILLLKCLSLG